MQTLLGVGVEWGGGGGGGGGLITRLSRCTTNYGDWF